MADETSNPVKNIQMIDEIETEKSTYDVNSKQGEVVAILPAYNEELTIGTVVLCTRKHVGAVVVIDDESSDRTAEVAKLAGATVITVNHTGKAGAMMAGFSYVRTLSPSCVVMLDSDGQHNPDEIPRVIQPIITGIADLVIGSRFIKADSEDGIQGYRKLGQKVLNKATNITSSIKCTDSQSGFRALSSLALSHMDFHSNGYNLESDMLVHAATAGLKITEVPITVAYDAPNMHKSGPIRHGLAVLSGIFQLFTVKHPLICFGTPGLVIFGIGLYLAIDALNIAKTTGVWATTLTLVACLMLVFSMLLISVAIILNSLSRLIKK